MCQYLGLTPVWVSIFAAATYGDNRVRGVERAGSSRRLSWLRLQLRRTRRLESPLALAGRRNLTYNCSVTFLLSI